MKDPHTDVSVLVDRALGGASISDGELEIMLHRYLFVFSIVQGYKGTHSLGAKDVNTYLVFWSSNITHEYDIFIFSLHADIVLVKFRTNK